MDNIARVMNTIKEVIDTNENVQIFMSFNNPFVLNYFPHVIIMFDGSVLELHSAEEAFEEMEKHVDFYNARYDEEGRPKADYNQISSGDIKVYYK